MDAALTELERINLLQFWDVLLPGDGRWPAASIAITDADTAWGMMPQSEHAWLRQAAQTIAALAQEARVPAMQALEQAEPGAFNRVLGALYDTYYGTAAVHARVRVLAEAGPRDDSAHFGTDLLRQVIATQAGLRRL